VISNILVSLATLGTELGTPRQIAYYRGKGDEEKAKDIVVASLTITIVSSIIIATILALFSNVISFRIFHMNDLSPIIGIFAISIPITVIIAVLTAACRGFNLVLPNVYFQNIMRSTSFLLLVVVSIFVGLSFTEMMYMYPVAAAITLLAYLIYVTRKKLLDLFRLPNFSDMRQLAVFSIPLVVFAMLNRILTWTDTLMLGYFTDSTQVGLYNAALPLAHVLPIATNAMNFLYVPLVAAQYSRGLLEELRRTYQILSKWIFMTMLPVFLVFELYPKIILSSLFGYTYSGITNVMCILSAGFFLHIIVGPNGSPLLAMGDSKYLMRTTLFSAVINIIANILLIPRMGIMGAAIATTLALFIRHAVVSFKIYQAHRVHAFSWNYIKPVFITVPFAVIIKVLAETQDWSFNIWIVFAILISLYIVHAVSVWLTRSVDEEDIKLLQMFIGKLKSNKS
jgi:O-antigen/teichoic acid export membrane protein